MDNKKTKTKTKIISFRVNNKLYTIQDIKQITRIILDANNTIEIYYKNKPSVDYYNCSEILFENIINTYLEIINDININI